MSTTRIHAATDEDITVTTEFPAVRPPNSGGIDYQTSRRRLRNDIAFFAGMVTFVIFVTLVPLCLAIFPKVQPEFKVVSATVSLLNPTGSQLTAAWDMTIVAANSEHGYKVHIKSLEARIVCDDRSLIRFGLAPLRPFFLNQMEQTRLDMKLGMVGAQWVGDGVGDQISDDMSSKGLVSFGVRLSGSYDVHGSWKDTHVYDLCDRIQFRFSNNGTTGTLTEQRECKYVTYLTRYVWWT